MPLGRQCPPAPTTKRTPPRLKARRGIARDVDASVIDVVELDEGAREMDLWLVEVIPELVADALSGVVKEPEEDRADSGEHN
jgi:hypothetical protein